MIADVPMPPPTATASGCETRECWRRVRRKRALRWCRSDRRCRFRLLLRKASPGDRNWVHSTFGCETGGTYNPAVHNRSGTFHGGLQFSLTTWNGAQKYMPRGYKVYGDPHHLPIEHQKIVAIRLKNAEGARNHWPVCG